MFEFGVILALAGCILRLGLQLSAREKTKELAPQNVRLRNIELFLMERNRKSGYVDSWILMILGSLIILLTGVFN